MPKPAPVNERRPFPNVPRRLLTVVTIIGGLIGIFLSDLLHWSVEQSFIFTLLIAGGLVALTALVYSALRR